MAPLTRAPRLNPSLTRLGRAAVGAAILGFALLQFQFGTFIPGRAPAWPAGTVGEGAFVVLSGAFLVVVAISCIADRGSTWSGLAAASLILVWGLLRRVPDVIAQPGGIALTNAGKALAITGGMLVVAGSARAAALTHRHVMLSAGRLGLGAFMAIGAVQHVRFTQFVAQLIPAWLPARVPLAYFAGAALLAGGVGMQVPQVRRRAALLSALMLGSWVFLVHIPRALAAATPADSRNEWTALCEALCFAGTALIIGATTGRD